MWIMTNCGKFLKRWEYQTTLPASWEICMQVKKQQLELGIEQWSGSKLEKEYVKTGYCHPVSVQLSQSIVSDSLQPHGLPHTRLPYPSPTTGACSNLCPLSWWCHPAISSSVVPFSFCLQPFPASESFPVSQFFTSGGQSIGPSNTASALPMNIQDWFPLWLTALISLLSKGLSRVFISTTVLKHQLLGSHPFLWSISHIHTWPLEKP